MVPSLTCLYGDVFILFWLLGGRGAGFVRGPKERDTNDVLYGNFWEAVTSDRGMAIRRYGADYH